MNNELWWLCSKVMQRWTTCFVLMWLSPLSPLWVTVGRLWHRQSIEHFGGSDRRTFTHLKWPESFCECLKEFTQHSCYSIVAPRLSMTWSNLRHIWEDLLGHNSTLYQALLDSFSIWKYTMLIFPVLITVRKEPQKQGENSLFMLLAAINQCILVHL